MPVGQIGGATVILPRFVPCADVMEQERAPGGIEYDRAFRVTGVGIDGR